MADTTDLIRAAKVGDLSAFLELPENEVINSHKDKFGYTLLSIAARNGHKEVVKLLLAKHADTSANTTYGGTPLSAAAYNGHKDVVEILLPYTNNIDFKHAVVAAASGGHEDVFEFLFENFNINPREKGACVSTAVKYAAKSGRISFLRWLLARDEIDLSSRNNEGYLALICAAEAGHENVVELLLGRHDIDINARDRNNNTALYLAAKARHINVVALLIKKNNIDVNIKNEEGNTVLHCCAINGYTEMYELLHSRNDIDMNARNQNGNTALYLAAKAHHIDVVAMLIERTDVNVCAENEKSNTLLHLCALYADTEIYELLHTRDDIDINAKNQDGDTILHLCVRYCRTEIYERLHSRADIDIKARNNSLDTALLLSAKYSPKICGLILTRDDININEKDAFKKTALDYVLDSKKMYLAGLLFARDDLDLKETRFFSGTSLQKAVEMGHYNLLDFLLAREYPGRTPLSWAAENGQTKILRILLARDAIDINLRDGDGRTPLSRGVFSFHKVVVEMLLRHNADPNSTDIDGKTPLWWALESFYEAIVMQLIPVDTVTLLLLTQEGNEATIKLLLRFKPRLDQRNHHGRTALHLAALSGRLEIAKALILQGAETSLRDHDGITPLQLAMQRKNYDLIQVLLEHQASTKGIMAKDWRDVYGKQKGDVILLSEAPYGKQCLHFPEAFPASEELSQTSAEIKSRMYMITDDLNSVIWSKVPITVTQQQPVMNHLQISEKTKNNALDISISLRLSINQYINGQPSTIGDTNKASKIMWRIIQPINPGSPWTPILYCSTLPYGWIPDDGVDLFQQFITYTRTQWLELCQEFGKYLSHKRLEQLESKGKNSDITDCLAKDAQRLAELRTLLTAQTSEAEKFMKYYCSHYNANEVPKTLRTLLEDDFGIGINRKIDDLDQTVRDLLQIELAWTSIHETRISTKLGRNVMLLTYVSIFYLPLGFCAALWAIPNIMDSSTRVPFILTATVVSLVTLSVTFNMEKIVATMQLGYQFWRNGIPRELKAKKKTQDLNLP